MVTEAVLDRLTDAAVFTVEMAGADRDYLTVTTTMLQGVGGRVAEEIGRNERLSLFVAGLIDADGSLQPGGILLTEHRVLVAWRRGRGLGKTQVRSHNLDDIETVTQFLDQRGRDNTCLAFSADGDFYGVLFSAGLTKPGFTNLVEGYLDGSMKPAWEEDTTDAVDRREVTPD